MRGGDGGGQCEHDALGNQSELDKTAVGGEFPSDGVAVGGGLSVEVLVACLVVAYAGDQMVSHAQEWQRDLARSVIGVGHEVIRGVEPIGKCVAAGNKQPAPPAILMSRHS